MDEELRAKFPFKNGCPGLNWLAAFYKRNRNEQQFAVPRPQEAKRHQAWNAEVYMSHFAALEALVAEYNLDDERIWNLDETGCTPGRDVTGKRRERRFLR